MAGGISKYQQYPQYRLLNHGMSLHEFKYIFTGNSSIGYWGDSLGLCISFLLYFFKSTSLFQNTKQATLAGPSSWRPSRDSWVGTWLKVVLIDNPFVSHFRLAAHFGLALLIFCFLFGKFCWFLYQLKQSTFMHFPLHHQYGYFYYHLFSNFIRSFYRRARCRSGL